jgi:hypothetical protein
MLYENNKLVKEVHFKNKYDKWKNRLDPSEYKAIETELNNKINGHPVINANELAASINKGIVFIPIFKKAAISNKKDSSLCFGLFLFATMMKRDDKWDTYSGPKCRIYKTRKINDDQTERG